MYRNDVDWNPLKAVKVESLPNCVMVKLGLDLEHHLTEFDVFSTVHHSIELFHLPTLMHNSLFINIMYVTLLSSTCFEH